MAIWGTLQNITAGHLCGSRKGSFLGCQRQEWMGLVWKDDELI